ncbi:DUF1826 domain-containing protein [Tistrella bauzanensis]|jgi:hypothetical protein|uniref:DUF1826 domain-containing protein n=1 Tax=Tistrella TaxID=171436 RepID=UPI0031F70E50
MTPLLATPPDRLPLHVSDVTLPGLVLLNCGHALALALVTPAAGVGVWRRPALAFQAALAACPADALPDGRVTIAATDDAIATGLHQLLSHSRLPMAVSAGIAADAAALARHFARASAARRLQIRLDAVNGPACRRFHQDHVRARLLCSYRGPGTELAPANVDLNAGPAAFSLDTAWVAVLRGHRHPLGAGPLLHRSPQTAQGAPAETRLLLAIDADPDDGRS